MARADIHILLIQKPPGKADISAKSDVKLHQNRIISLRAKPMAGTRASLSISAPNEEWIQEQIASREFSSRSEVINDLIRRAREIAAIRAKLIAAEQSVAKHGWVTETPQQMLDGFKEKARRGSNL